MYKITETTDDQYIGIEVEFTFDPIEVSEDFTFDWEEIRKTGKGEYTVSNSNYSMALKKV